MSRSVTIASGKYQIALPDGSLYDAGETTILTDAEFEAIRDELIPGTVIDNGPTAPSLTEATDPTTTMALANAMRQLLIDAGLAQE